MTAMLDGLVVHVADELRSATGPAAANDDDGPALVAQLRASGLLDIPDLVALLLERAGQIQLGGAIQLRGRRREGRLLQAKISDSNAPVAAAAMALILARGRRLDRFGQCRLEFDDLPAGAVAPLVHSIAASIARGDHPAMAAAATRLIARHQPDRSLGAVTANLVDALAAHRGLDDDWLVAAAEEGECAIVAHTLARRSGIDAGQAWAVMVAGDGDTLMLLLRLAEAGRESAARILALLCDASGIAEPAAALARFDDFSAADLDRARAAAAIPLFYRDALAVLGTGDGKRAF